MKRLVVCIAGALAGDCGTDECHGGPFVSRGIDQAELALHEGVTVRRSLPMASCVSAMAIPPICAPQRIEDVRFQPTPERLSELDEVNRWANHALRPRPIRRSTASVSSGPIPKIAATARTTRFSSRAMLLARGWPKSSLLLTVVRDEKGEGHAVLTARTAQGDFVLDNKVDDVRLWNMSGLLLHHAPVVSRSARVGFARRQRPRRARCHRRRA